MESVDGEDIPEHHQVIPVDEEWEIVKYWDPTRMGIVSIRRKRIKSHLYRDID